MSVESLAFKGWESDVCNPAAFDLAAKSQSAADLDAKNVSNAGAKSLLISFLAGSLATASALALFWEGGPWTKSAVESTQKETGYMMI
jgi:hypothetical protein